MTMLIRNCRLVPELTEGSTLTQADLLIQEGKIAEIAPCGTVFPEKADQELDAKGMTALPGLIDAHIHLTMTHDLTSECCFIYPCDRAFEDLEYAQYLLGIGITTVRDCGEDKDFSVTALRNAVNSGKVKGPRILTSGITLNVTEAGTTPDLEYGYMAPYNVDNPYEMRKAARINMARGCDFLKLYCSGSMMARGSNPGQPIMFDDEIIEGVKVAQMKETYVAAHCHGTEAIEQILRCGVSTVEHASFIGPESIARLAGEERRGIVPTLGIDSTILDADPNTVYGQEVLHKVVPILEKMKVHLNAAYEDGRVLIGWGTDAPISAYRNDPGLEFRMRKEYLGWDNLDLLKQATINSAKLLRIDDEVGTIKAGKCADVILVDGDPVRDISVMYQPAAHVIRAGELYK